MRSRRGAVDRASGLGVSVAAAVRRRQRDREPRVMVYDASGSGRLLHDDAPAHARIVKAADELVALVGPA